MSVARCDIARRWWSAWVVAVAVFIGVGVVRVHVRPAAAATHVVTGSYTGNATDNREITGLGFQPDVVFVFSANSADDAVARTNTMTGDVSDSLEDDASAFAPDLIESLDSTGFTVGTDNRVNRNTETIYWFALEADATNMKTGTYTGTGIGPNAITGVGFQPDVVWIFGEGNFSPRLGYALDPTRTYEFGGFEHVTLGITSYDSDGFTVDTEADVNTNGSTYHYVAFKEAAGAVDVGSYIGDGVDDRSITGLGLDPELVIVKNADKVFPVFKTGSTGPSVDKTLLPTAGTTDDSIQALITGGFKVGTLDGVNQPPITAVSVPIYYFAFKRSTTTGTPVLSGSYTGDGTDSRGITGVGFQPDVVFVLNENSNDDGVARTNTMTGDVSDSLEDDASPFASNLIESLDTGGFTVGSDNRVNRSGETTHWFAVKADAANMKTGTYTGTGSTLPITGVGFQPDLVWIFGKGSHSPRLGFSLDPTRTYEFGGFEFGVLGITSYDADGFTLSSGGDVNASGVDYHYVAFIEDAGALDMGSYIGDGVDNRSVTGVGFQPELVMVKNSNTVFPVFKTESTGSSPPCQWE